jgi:hypothetical protein
MRAYVHNDPFSSFTIAPNVSNIEFLSLFFSFLALSSE